MIDLGLNAADRRLYEATLAVPHKIRVTMSILDRNEAVLTTFRPGVVLAGAVQVDQQQAVSRLLQLRFLDVGRRLAFLPDSPSDAAAHADNHVAVSRDTWVPGLSGGDDWVPAPLFWGPITRLNRDGDYIVELEAQGKEALGLNPEVLWRSLQIHKGEKRTSAIRRILAAKGEARFTLPELTQKMTRHMSLAFHSEPWHFVTLIAHGMNRQLLYDGRGRVKCRLWPRNRMFAFRSGAGGNLLTRPKISYDLTQARNVIEVLGPEPKGPPKRIRSVARAPNWHPLSAERLARNGVPRVLVETIDTNLAVPELPKKPTQKQRKRHHAALVHRQSEADAMAARELDNLLVAQVDIQFDALPAPHLEEGDRVALIHNGEHVEFVLRQFTIPLTATDPMSVGYLRHVSWGKRKG